jgi:hypothetical protein
LQFGTLQTALRLDTIVELKARFRMADAHLIASRTIVARLAVICLGTAGIAAGADAACKMVQVAELPVRVVKNKLIVDVPSTAERWASSSIPVRVRH